MTSIPKAVGNSLQKHKDLWTGMQIDTLANTATDKGNSGEEKWRYLKPGETVHLGKELVMQWLKCWAENDTVVVLQDGDDKYI